ncbi:menaquinone-specific isochorismate synthase [Thermocatellispora tengchongensis]|uniref:isochorismate synthase n=2 Tax=Thermocatellispora tengchongensis TaxID=1073253 RepID=A0A840PC29_9ACTN|nr:isochorismate synthase [Thermocatellispora tengchongensis]MBB5138974.1 menaquinone-specific isochorismate synthase [Thermocatellispora tengchongensis]
MVRTVPVADPGDLLARLPERAPYAWVRHGEGLVGWGEAARTTVPPGPGRFAWAREWLAQVLGEAHTDDSVHRPGSGPVAFGSFTFDPDSPGSVLVVPKAVLARRDGRAWLTTVGDAPMEVVTPLRDPGAILYGDGSLTAPEWQHAVARAVDRINDGELEKVVLARDLNALAEHRIDVRLLLTRLVRRYPECYTFSCAGLVGATPELLVRHTGEAIESLILAGTIARGGSPEDDARRGAALLASEKDRHEHHCAVESVRDALAPLCKDLTIPDSPELLKLSNVQHLASPVSGRLSDGASVLDVVAALHPTAAVGGTPTGSAVSLIRELEGMDRAGYSGPVGWIDAHGDGEWGIALRCGQIEGSRARLFAGCGIMGNSRPAAELAEAQAKLRVMQYALEG